MQSALPVPVLEDKIVQRATAEVLGAVYEADFKGFSYGFRPKRGAHNALDALTVGISKKKVSWVLDADIRGFFDALSHEWLVKFIEHRIADRRVVRQIRKWLNAGVLEDGCRTYPEEGSPQGGSISPVLRSVVSGHYRYFAVPRNYPALQAFRFQVIGYWRQTLRRRSQKSRITWAKIKKLARQWIPTPRILHPYPEERLIVRT